jgi:hypothetical protein
MAYDVPFMRFRELAGGGPDPRFPIPDWMVGIHRGRLVDMKMMGAADFTASDWNVSTVAGGSAALASLVSTNNGPALLVAGSTTGDSYTARHNAMHLQMPVAAQAHHYYVAFDICRGTAAHTTVNVAVGIATGTAAQAWTPATGALFNAGGGIAWSCVGTSMGGDGVWRLTMKPSAKSAVVIGVAPASVGLLGSNWVRVGFMVAANPSVADAGWIVGFAYPLIDPAFGGDDQDDQPVANPSFYVPGMAGRSLDTTNLGDSGSIQAGLFFGMYDGTAAVRQLGIRRIVTMDNMRR